MELLSSGGSSKRAKAPAAAAGNVIQVASCLVDGCNSDLSGCREYHRRHKVCEQHSKTPKVTIRGQEQRFCQQCSRFHSLIEFDEGKRSCRKRLDGHNRRRRKPQLESFHTNPGVFLSTHQQGSRLLSFSNPQMLAAGGCSGWAAIGDVKRDQDDTSTMVFNSPSNYISNIDKQNLLSRCSGDMSNNYNLQGTDGEASSSACFDQVSAISGNSQKMLLNGVSNSDGALSLLSSAAIQTQTRDDDPLNIGSSSHMMPDPRNIIPIMPQSLLHNLHFSGIGGDVSHRMQTNPRVSDLQLDNNANLTTLHFQGDSSGNLVSHQTLSFSWD